MNTTTPVLPDEKIEAFEIEEILIPGLAKATMKGLVYGGPGIIELKDIPIPEVLEPTDIIVKILKTTICGTDLGILHGKTPSVLPGTTLGHEGVGIVDEVGVN